MQIDPKYVTLFPQPHLRTMANESSSWLDRVQSPREIYIRKRLNDLVTSAGGPPGYCDCVDLFAGGEGPWDQREVVCRSLAAGASVGYEAAVRDEMEVREIEEKLRIRHELAEDVHFLTKKLPEIEQFVEDWKLAKERLKDQIDEGS